MVYPACPSFNIKKWGIRGYTFHGHVFQMLSLNLYIDNFQISISIGNTVNVEQKLNSKARPDVFIFVSSLFVYIIFST